MANNRGNQAYRFELYEPVIIPQEVPASKVLGPQHIVKTKKKSIAQARNEAKIVNRKIYKCVFAGLILFALIAATVFFEAQLYMLDLRKTELNSELQAQISESVRLNTALANKVPMNEVEKYAVDNLGMVKASRSQRIYINMQNNNSATYYGVEKDSSAQAE